MLWEIIISVVTVLLTILFMVWKDTKNLPADGTTNGILNGGNHPKIQKRLLNFADFFKYITHDKTANHIGSPEMKLLRGMMCHRSLDDLSPAVLRGWSRALRDRVGTFHNIKLETAQLQENVAPLELHSTKQQQTKTGVEEKPHHIYNEFCQMIAEVEFTPLEKKDQYDFKSPSTSSMDHSPQPSPTASQGTSSGEGKSVSSAAAAQTSAPIVCPCLIRFRTDPKERNPSSNDNGDQQEDRGDPIRESIVGFHVLPPKDEKVKKPFDIVSFIDPFELDQFAESAVETLFEKRWESDPFEGFWRYCVRPLQELYDLKKQEEREKLMKEAEENNKKKDGEYDDEEEKKKKAAAAAAAAAKTLASGLPPKQRRDKLANDMKKLKRDMGYNAENNERTFSFSTTMNNAELDEKTYTNAKSICARVTHTGPDRDCIVTLHILLDAESPFGVGIVKYNFGLTAPKKKTMLFDQDSQNPLGTF